MVHIASLLRMNRQKINLKRILLHPFLFGSYFILALLGSNIEQVKTLVALRPLFVVLIGSAILLIVLRLIMKEWLRAAAAATLLLVFFFSYGHIYHYLEEYFNPLGRHRLLIPIWGVFAGVSLYWITRRQRNLSEITVLLNIISIVLLIFPLYQIASFKIRLLTVGQKPSEHLVTSSLTLPEEQPPDIYLIIVDEYTRADVLENVYKLDNTDFLQELASMDFNIIECSQSNYAQTELVLASMLNLDYLDALDERLSEDTADHALLRGLIKDSIVERTFRELGYNIVAFETGYYFSELEDADVYLTPNQSLRQSLLGGMNGFEVMLFKNSAALIISDATTLLEDFINTNHPHEIKRQQALYTLDMLARLPEEVSSPKFVFAHILVTHEPFVFGADGEALDYPDNLDNALYKKAYRDQVDFLNQQLLEVLNKIIAHSGTPPVIIIQGDTGPGRVSNDYRMAIFSAMYLPDNHDMSLPITLTPVNNFRLIFDQYFDGSLGLLEDVSLFSLYTDSFNFKPIPNTCAGE